MTGGILVCYGIKMYQNKIGVMVASQHFAALQLPIPPIPPIPPILERGTAFCSPQWFGPHDRLAVQWILPAFLGSIPEAWEPVYLSSKKKNQKKRLWINPKILGSLIINPL